MTCVIIQLLSRLLSQVPQVAAVHPNPQSVGHYRSRTTFNTTQAGRNSGGMLVYLHNAIVFLVLAQYVVGFALDNVCGDW